MLDFLGEIIGSIILNIITLVIEYLLKPVFRFLKLPTIDRFFDVLTPISAIAVICWIIWTLIKNY